MSLDGLFADFKSQAISLLVEPCAICSRNLTLAGCK